MDEGAFLVWIQAAVWTGALSVVATLVYAVILGRRLGRTIEPADIRLPLLLGSVAWGGILFVALAVGHVIAWWMSLLLFAALMLATWGYVSSMQRFTEANRARKLRDRSE